MRNRIDAENVVRERIRGLRDECGDRRAKREQVYKQAEHLF